MTDAEPGRSKQPLRVRHAGPPPLPRAVLAVAIASGGTALLIHEQVCSGHLQMFLRDWVLHLSAVLFAVLLTSALLGYHRQRDDRATVRVLRLGCVVPFALLALHELGQWTWPAGPRDPIDSLRDTGLNALGTAIGAWLLWRTRPRPSATACAAP